MKILAISLLRAGDLVMTTPALQGLKKRYPGAEIHLLTHKQNQGILPILPMVDVAHYIDRKQIQDDLISASAPLLRPYDDVKNIVDNLNGEKYELIINYTQTRFSAWLLGLVSGDVKIGMSFDQRGQVNFGSPWFRYINDFVAAGEGRPLNYSDIFYFGSALDESPEPVTLSETEKGRAEINELEFLDRPFILVQPFTSDDKKNWGVEFFVDTLALIHRLDPKIEFVASGAPFEKDSLLDFQSRCANQGVTLHTALCSFEGAFSLIKRAKGIIVGDTCLKHMAAGSDAKVIELSLGSSHLYKTGAYKKNAVILQPKVSCLPCPHRNPCQFTEHMCAKNLVPEIVAPVVTQLLMNNWEGIRAIASEFADEIDVFRTFKLGGIWSAVNLADSQSAVEQALESVSWKFLLSRTNKINLFPFGSVGSELGLFFQEAAVALTADEFQEKARSLESRLMAQDEDLLKLQMNFSQKLRTENGDLLPFIKEYGDMALAMPWLQDSSFGFLVKESLQLAETKNHTDFSMIRRLQTIIEQAYEQNKIKLKLLRSVRMDDVEAR